MHLASPSSFVFSPSPISPSPFPPSLHPSLTFYFACAPGEAAGSSPIAAWSTALATCRDARGSARMRKLVVFIAVPCHPRCPAWPLVSCCTLQACVDTHELVLAACPASLAMLSCLPALPAMSACIPSCFTLSCFTLPLACLTSSCFTSLCTLLALPRPSCAVLVLLLRTSPSCYFEHHQKVRHLNFGIYVRGSRT